MSLFGAIRQVRLRTPEARLSVQNYLDGILAETRAAVRQVDPRGTAGRSLGQLVSVLVVAIGDPAVTAAVEKKLAEIEQHLGERF